MKTGKWFILALALLCLALGPALADMPEDHLGEALPDFTVATIDGGVFTLSEALEEKDMVLINLWATWCPPCEMEFPYLEAAYERYQDRVAVVALSVEPNDDVDALTAYAEAHGLTFPIGSDAEIGLGNTFATLGIPTSMVVDRFGNVAFVEVGAQTETSRFTRLFDAFIGEDYAHTEVLYEIPPQRPTVDAADPVALAGALNAEGSEIAFRNPDDASVWPMVPVEKDGRGAVMSTNALEPNTRAAVYADVTCAEGEALAFDFATSTEAAADLLTIEVDGARVKCFGGAHDWTTWVLPLEPGAHEIAFSYVKDALDDAGEDAVWLDEVRLVGEAEAAALLAALPVYPVGEAFAITLTGDNAKEIVFEGDADGVLVDYFASQSYWIVSGGVAEAAITLSADVDPEAAFCYSNYDGAQAAMSACLRADRTGYAFSSGVDSLETTGYPNTNIYVHPRADIEDIDELRGVMLFADEENVNALVAELAAQGVELTWRYADGGAAATGAAAEGDSGMSTYTVTFADQFGDPVPGCIINFCTDELCVPVVANANGVAVYVGVPEIYHLQVIKVPAGYDFDTAREFYAEPAGGDLSFTVTKLDVSTTDDPDCRC